MIIIIIIIILLILLFGSFLWKSTKLWDFIGRLNTKEQITNFKNLVKPFIGLSLVNRQ